MSRMLKSGSCRSHSVGLPLLFLKHDKHTMCPDFRDILVYMLDCACMIFACFNVSCLLLDNLTEQHRVLVLIDGTRGFSVDQLKGNNLH